MTRLGYAPATLTHSGASLYAALIREGVGVMRAHGVEPGDHVSATARAREVADLPLNEAVDLVRDLATNLIAMGYTWDDVARTRS